MGARNLVTLADGRRISYRAFGDPSGAPLLYFHGTPSSSAEFEGLVGEELPRRLGLRVLALDRPGVGRSDPAPGRHVMDWADDVTAFVEVFGIKRFAVIGYAGGAPYALACAAVLGSRITSTTVVSPSVGLLDEALTEALGPTTLHAYRTATTRPFLHKLALRRLSRTARRTPAKLITRLTQDAADVDAEALADDRVAGAYAQAIVEAMEQGPAAAHLDTRLIADPSEVPTELIDQTVRIWHGSEDRSTPPVVVDALERHLPSAERRELEGEGHTSILVRRSEEILTESRIAAAAT